MVQNSVLCPVKFSQWASPIVVVEKKDGSIRICTDFKRTLNKVIDVEHYPLPQLEDVFVKAQGGRFFTVLDMTGAFQQLKIAESCEELFTINTPFGLYRYKRLTYGVSSAPAIFQRVMETILAGIPRVIVYIDDVFISGRDEEETRRLTKLVLDRLRQYNVQINFDKSKFMCEEVEYLGHTFNQDGIQPTKAKMDCILESIPPENLKQLRSYVGMLNFYHRFVPELSTVLKPLYELTKKGQEFQWSSECQAAFEESKKRLCQNSLIVPYDPTKEIVVASDASPWGLGGCLSIIINGMERPVMFASCTLSETERKYCQLQKEALAIVFCLKKFHRYIYGRKFTLVTDHEPLKLIFDPQKDVPVLAAQRIQRNPSLESSTVEDTVASFNLSSDLPLCYHAVAEETVKDPVLLQVLKYLEDGWPKNEQRSEMKPFFSKRYELNLEQGCILWGSRVVIPTNMRQKVLQMLHDQHVGIVRCKMLGRSVCWWPSMNEEIEAFVGRCLECQTNRRSEKKDVFSPWPSTSSNWERLHLDFCQLYGQNYLIVFDAHTKWIEVFLMKTTTAGDVVQILRSLFARFGIPVSIVSDNGPPFTSTEFVSFLQGNSVKVFKSPAYHPESNGSAERAVQTAKQTLRSTLKHKKKPAEIQLALENFVFKYRNTPSTSTGQTPSDMMLKHKARTLLNILKPSPFNQPPNRPTLKTRKALCVGDKVTLKWKPNTPAIPARILHIVGHNTYLVNVNNTVKMAHADQLRASDLDENMFPGLVILPNVSESVTDHSETEPLERDKGELAAANTKDGHTSGEGADLASPKVRRSERFLINNVRSSLVIVKLYTSFLSMSEVS
ncbi:uncharacterized protein K02A2.6-like [Aedes albopictus]|uniref:RNA-directed DNA polymerase n=1 Tax=Aedes albopictus TaxID=7160 RepID=A0ABM1Y7C5_AEDAL